MFGLFGAIVGAPLGQLDLNRLESVKRPYVAVHFLVFTVGSFSFM